MTPKSLLIVEDDDAILTTLTKFLEETGWPVHGVHDTRAALEELESRPPEILIADLHVRPDGGLKVIEWAFAMPAPPRVLVYSGHTEEIALARAKFPQLKILAKPVRTLDEVTEALEDLFHDE